METKGLWFSLSGESPCRQNKGRSLVLNHENKNGNDCRYQVPVLWWGGVWGRWGMCHQASLWLRWNFSHDSASLCSEAIIPKITELFWWCLTERYDHFRHQKRICSTFSQLAVDGTWIAWVIFPVIIQLWAQLPHLWMVVNSLRL